MDGLYEDNELGEYPIVLRRDGTPVRDKYFMLLLTDLCASKSLLAYANEAQTLKMDPEFINYIRRLALEAHKLSSASYVPDGSCVRNDDPTVLQWVNDIRSGKCSSLQGFLDASLDEELCKLKTSLEERDTSIEHLREVIAALREENDALIGAISEEKSSTNNVRTSDANVVDVFDGTVPTNLETSELEMSVDRDIIAPNSDKIYRITAPDLYLGANIRVAYNNDDADVPLASMVRRLWDEDIERRRAEIVSALQRDDIVTLLAERFARENICTSKHNVQRDLAMVAARELIRCGIRLRSIEVYRVTPDDVASSVSVILEF